MSTLFTRAATALQSLTRLDLSKNEIGAESITSIATALANSPLHRLDLSHNPLGDESFLALEDAIRGDSFVNLLFLYLQGALTNDADVNITVLSTLIDATSSHCPRISILDLSKNNFGSPDTSVKVQISMHNENDRTLISTLDLRDSCMTDKNVRDLFQRAASALQSIEVVNLSNNRVGAEGITSIATAVRMSPINRLSDLDLSLNHLGDSGLTALKQAVVNDSFVYVQTLNLQGSLMDIDGELFQAFADAITNHCPVLSKLNVSHNNMGAPLISQDISHQENSKLQIDSLDSDNVLPSKSMLDYFLRSSPPLQSLEVLNLGSNKIEAEGVASLTRALMRFRVPSTNNLSNLNMSNNPLGLSGLKALQDAMNSEVLVNLRKLNLEGSLANDADINVVALSRFVEVLTIKCPYLKKLNLSSNNFVGERECGMHAEEPLFGINRDGISLAPSASSNHGRLYFIYCHLCRLSLSKHKLTSAVHDSTANIDTTAYYEPVEDEVMLEQVDPNNTIKKLVLNNNDFSHEGIHLLSSFVHVCSRLKYLRTNHCKINSDSLTILLTQISKQQASKQRFKVCSNLKSWDLSNNTIDDIGISVLLDCLPSVFSSLVDVDIDDNLITSSMTDVAEKEIQKHKKVIIIIWHINMNV